MVFCLRLACVDLGYSASGGGAYGGQPGPQSWFSELVQ